MAFQKPTLTSLAILAYLCGPICSVSAQSPNSQQEGNCEERMLSPSIKHVRSAFSRMASGKESWIILGAGIGAALSVHPFDDDISAELRTPDRNGWQLKIPNQLGGFWVMAGGSLLTHFGSRLAKHIQLANTSLYVMEAILVSHIITIAGKYTVRRLRPDGSNSRSFPSGHATATMTLASVLHKRHGWKAGVPAYLLAAYVGLGRIRSQKHFASDVLAGATIGMIVGRSFVPPQNPKRHLGIVPDFGRDYVGVYAVVKF